MARVIALMALAALGLAEAPVHEPVYDHHSERLMSTTESYHAPRNIRPLLGRDSATLPDGHVQIGPIWRGELHSRDAVHAE